MAKEDKPNVFGGFEALAGQLTGVPSALTGDDDIFEGSEEEEEESGEEGSKKKVEDPKTLNVDPEELQRLGEEESEEEEDEGEESEEEEEDEQEEEEEESEETGDDESEDFEFSEYETPLTQLVQEELFKELGWELGEDEKFEKVSDLVEYMTEAVTAASEPQFANEEVKKLDDFVKQGGKLEDYFEKVPAGTLDLDNANIEDEAVQKQVLREYLSTVLGYKEDRVERHVKRREDSGDLEEEAEEAVELLKEYKKESQEKLLDAQKNFAEQQKRQQQKFFSDVEESISALDDIRGITLSKKDKQDLLDYIFKPDSDGRTTYQRDYASDAVTNLIESAFFTKDKKTNTLVNKAKKSAKSEAVKEIHRKIKASKGKRQKNSGSQSGADISDTLGRLGQSLIKKI